MKKRRRKKRRKVLTIVIVITIMAIVGYCIGYWGTTGKTTNEKVATEEESAITDHQGEQLLSATVVTQAVSVNVKAYPSSSKDEREVKKVSSGKDGAFMIYAPKITSLVACEISRVDNKELIPRPEICFLNESGDVEGNIHNLLQDGGAVAIKKLEKEVSYKIVLCTEDEAYEIFVKPF